MPRLDAKGSKEKAGECPAVKGPVTGLLTGHAGTGSAPGWQA